MDINDPSVLDILNSFIASERLNKLQILHTVELVSISDNIKDLEDNIRWETFKSKD